jgi:hypothetical protein
MQHPLLETVKNALHVQCTLRPNDVDYNFLVNCISIAVASLPDYTPPRLGSGVESSLKSGDGAPLQGTIGANGKIFTGYYKNFRSLPYDDQQRIFKERVRLDINTGGGGCNKRSGRGGKGRTVSAVQTTAAGNRAVMGLTKKIAALTTQVNEAQKKKRTSDNLDDDDDVPDTAGNAFGGRSSKKNKN